MPEDEHSAPRALAPAEGRELFGGVADAYASARAPYPERVYDVLRERCGLAAGTRVLEIGPGTGIATRRLLEHGADVVAVEPDALLAALLRRALPAVDVRAESFEEAELDGGFDLVAAASSFHWVDPAVGPPKVRSQLRPGGWWAVWWTNYGDPTRPDPFREAVRHVLERLPHSPSRSVTAEVRAREAAAAGLVEVATEVVPWTVELDASRVRSLHSTFSPVASLPRATREPLLDELARIVREELGGRVVRPVRTSLCVARNPL